MLTDEQKFNNKTRFIDLLSRLNIDLTPIMKYLDEVDFFEKPASTQYTAAYAGGLCEQALNLAHSLGVLCNAYFPGKYTDEDIIKVSLFRDIYKAELYEYYIRNVKNDTTGQWEQVVAYRNKEVRPVYGDMGFSSYMIARKFIDFTDEQIEAIIHGNGLNNFSPDIHEILKNHKLVTLLKMADLANNFLGD